MKGNESLEENLNRPDPVHVRLFGSLYIYCQLIWKEFKFSRYFPPPPPPPAVGKESPALCSYTRPRYGHSFIKPLLDTCAVSHVFKVFWVPACLGVARWSAPTPWPDPAHHVMCDEGQANQGQRVIGSISTRAVLCFRKMPPGHVWRNISRRHVSI